MMRTKKTTTVHDAEHNAEPNAEQVAAQSSVTGELAFTLHDSPVGELLLAKHAETLVLVSYLDHSRELGEELSRLSIFFNKEPVQNDALFRTEVMQFDEYFAGTRDGFDLNFSLELAQGFQRDALQQVLAVPYGETASYREIAIMAGRPNAYRAVGTSCGHNPLVLVIPCHRVIKADGTVGDYGTAGRLRKEFLLELEATH